MRRFIAIVVLILFPAVLAGEMGSFDVRILELRDKGNDEYALKLVQLSEPYGYKHKKDREITIHLRFKCPTYECTDPDTQPTLKEYHQAIDLLKQRLSSKSVTRFGVAGRGFALIEGTKNQYQSNALEIKDGIVCSDYDFFDL